MKKSIKNTMKLLPALLLLALAEGNAVADSNKTPTDLDKMLVYISTTPFTPVDGTFMVDGMMGDGMHFQKEVLKRTDEEIAQDRNNAIDFFQSRFGISVTDPRVHFSGFEILPELEYRAVVISGENVPPKGWPVHDGGWMVIVMDPHGIDLGGEFAGTHVTPGTMFVHANYLIDKKPTPVLLNYQAKRPIVPDTYGSFQVNCEIFSEQYGNGQAIGGTLPVALPDGRMLINTRNIITFPPFGKTAAEILSVEAQ